MDSYYSMTIEKNYVLSYSYENKTLQICLVDLPGLFYRYTCIKNSYDFKTWFYIIFYYSWINSTNNVGFTATSSDVKCQKFKIRGFNSGNFPVDHGY